MVRHKKSNVKSSTVKTSTKGGVEFKGFTKTGKGIFVINGKTYHTSFGATVNYNRLKEGPYNLTEKEAISIIKRGTDTYKKKMAKVLKQNLIKVVSENYSQLVPQMEGNLFLLNPNLQEHFTRLVKKIPLYKLDKILDEQNIMNALDTIMKFYHNPYDYDINVLNNDFKTFIRRLEQETNTKPFMFKM